MFSRSTTYAIWIISTLSPLRGDLERCDRRGGRISALGLSGADISKRCGFAGPCNFEISRLLNILVENQVLRIVYPNNSKIPLYTLNLDLEKMSLLDLVNLIDFGVRLGEPDIHRAWTDGFMNEPRLKRFIELSFDLKQNINQMLRGISLAKLFD